MSTAPIVRFSPSPTGLFHVGGARTALFNWLFARQQGGRFLLRIEDTDAARNRDEWITLIETSMRWLGLDWDGEHQLQSAAFPRHVERAHALHAEGKAYYCGCTPEEVAARKASRGEKTPGYDGHCRDLALEPGPGRALRFRTPGEGSRRRADLIHDDVDIDLTTVEDFVLLRANGTPLYVYANALDDLDDGITHVIRGEDHLSNVPKQILIAEALGKTPPQWAHLPLIVNEKRQKLSKRRDKVALEAFRAEGILPEAMRNYLGTLGWSPPGGEEIVPDQVMVETFRLEDVVRSGAQFDQKKLLAFNGHYLRAMPREEFVDRALDWYRTTLVEPLAGLIQERGATFPETLSMTDFFLHDAPPMDGPSWDKTMSTEAAPKVLASAIQRFGALEDWTAEHLQAEIAALAEEHELKVQKAQAPIRVAVTGRTVGPPLFESLAVLGKARSLERLQRAAARVAKG